MDHDDPIFFSKRFFLWCYVVLLGGNDTKHANFVLLMATVLAVAFIAGCTSAPEKETVNQSAQEAPLAKNSADNVRYVEINLLDGTNVGGKYVSETAAFTTIIAMYTMDPSAYTLDAYNKAVKDPDKYFVKGNGAEISIKNSLINSMITIEDPTAMIEANLQEMNTTAAAIKSAAEKKAEYYRIEKEKREAKQSS